jgi:hypothetical protein
VKKSVNSAQRTLWETLVVFSPETVPNYTENCPRRNIRIKKAGKTSLLGFNVLAFLHESKPYVNNHLCKSLPRSSFFFSDFAWASGIPP